MTDAFRQFASLETMATDLDIITKLHLHPLMAWYGVKRSVQGADGQKLFVEVPAGIRDQTTLRLRGAGKIRGDDRGDILVEINIQKPRFFFLQKCLVVLASMLLGTAMIAQLSSPILWNLRLVLGSLFFTIGILMLAGIIQDAYYFGKHEMGLGAFICLSVFPALLINGFEFDLNFTWPAALSCATIGGILGTLSIQPNPKIQSLLAGILAGNGMLALIYFYTKHRETIWNFEIAVLVLLGVLVGLGLNWCIKRFF